MRSTCLLLFLLLFPAAPAGAQNSGGKALADSLNHIESRLFSAKNLRCEYGKGTVATYKGVLGIDSGPELKSDDTLTPAVFTNIDLAAHTAHLGNVQVAVFSSGHALHFLETTPSGNVVLTTVFATVFNDSGAYAAVTSRHIGMGIPGMPPIPSQYYGRCTPF